MYLVEESEYISGLVNLASSISVYMGVSFMDATCFKKKSVKTHFAQFYNIKKEDLKIQESPLSLEQFMKNSFGDQKELIESLCYWITLKAGKFIKIYEQNEDSKLNDLLSNSGYGKTPFYFVEDVTLIEFEKMTIAFITGNNE